MGRGRKWCAQEDEALARAYKISAENPIQGTDQKAAAFWEDVCRHTAAVFDGEARSLQAVKNRWSIISHDVAKFSGCVSRVKGRNESGKSEDDLTNDAGTLYQETHGSRFEFLSCWMILKSCPKFTAFGLPAHQKRGQKSSSEEQEESSLRPEGRDKAKKARLQHTAPVSTSTLLQQLLDHNREKNEKILEEIKRKNDLRDEELDSSFV